MASGVMASAPGTEPAQRPITCSRNSSGSAPISASGSGGGHGQEVPVEAEHRRPPVRRQQLELLDGGDDVERAQPLDAVGVVEREAVGDPSAAIVAHDGEPVVAERRHEGDDVGRHRALGVHGVLGVVGRRARAAVAAQVGHHHGVALGQRRARPGASTRRAAGSRAAARRACRRRRCARATPRRARPRRHPPRSRRTSSPRRAQRKTGAASSFCITGSTCSEKRRIDRSARSTGRSP